MFDIKFFVDSEVGEIFDGFFFIIVDGSIFFDKVDMYCMGKIF